MEVISPIILNFLNLSRRKPADIAPGTPVTNMNITNMPYLGLLGLTIVRAVQKKTSVTFWPVIHNILIYRRFMGAMHRNRALDCIFIRVSFEDTVMANL